MPSTTTPTKERKPRLTKAQRDAQAAQQAENAAQEAADLAAAAATTSDPVENIDPTTETPAVDLSQLSRTDLVNAAMRFAPTPVNPGDPVVSAEETRLNKRFALSHVDEETKTKYWFGPIWKRSNGQVILENGSPVMKGIKVHVIKADGSSYGEICVMPTSHSEAKAPYFIYQIISNRDGLVDKNGETVFPGLSSQKFENGHYHMQISNVINRKNAQSGADEVAVFGNTFFTIPAAEVDSWWAAFRLTLSASEANPLAE